jgi:hypothetical protein
MFLVIQRNTYFYGEFYIHLLNEFFVISNYDEMNYYMVSGVFTMYFKVYILVICNNHESDIGTNDNVKFVET